MPSPISEFAMPPVSAPKLPAPATTKAEQQKDSADVFGEAKPLLAFERRDGTRRSYHGRYLSRKRLELVDQPILPPAT
jgi:hypothetical protein